MLTMIVCYTIMGRVLWGSQSIGEHTQRQIESIKSKKKVCIARLYLILARILQIIHLVPKLKSICLPLGHLIYSKNITLRDQIENIN